MIAKLLLKPIFLVLVLSLLVIMGMHNRQMVPFSLPPIVSHPVSQPGRADVLRLLRHRSDYRHGLDRRRRKERRRRQQPILEA